MQLYETLRPILEVWAADIQRQKMEKFSLNIPTDLSTRRTTRHMRNNKWRSVWTHARVHFGQSQTSWLLHGGMGLTFQLPLCVCVCVCMCVCVCVCVCVAGVKSEDPLTNAKSWRIHVPWRKILSPEAAHFFSSVKNNPSEVSVLRKTLHNFEPMSHAYQENDWGKNAPN